MNDEQGQANAASFNQAFQSAFTRHDQQKMELDQQKKQMDMLKPIADAFKGADTPEKSMDILSKNPQWMANPITQPFVSKWMQTQGSIARTESTSLQAKMSLQDNKDFLTRMDKLDPDLRAPVRKAAMGTQGQAPNPESWGALSDAETAMADRRSKRAADLSASGLTPQEITVGDDGKTTIRYGKGKAGSITPQQKVALEDLRDRERSLNKELDAAQASDPDKVPAIQARLKDIHRKQFKITAAVGAEETGQPIEDIVDGDGEPTDETAAKLGAAQSAYKTAILGGGPDQIKKAKEDLSTAQTQVGRASALQKGRVVDLSKVDRTTLDTIKNWGVGQVYFDESKNSWNVVTQAFLDAVEKKLQAGEVPASSGPAIGTVIQEMPRSYQPSGARRGSD